MKLKLAIGVFLALLLTGNAVAQQAAASGSPATHEDIQRLFAVMRLHEQMQTTMQLIMAQQRKMIRETIKQHNPAVTEEQLSKMETMSKDIVKDMPLDGMLDDSIPIYQKHLTKGDVDAMTVFYSSPTGQKLLREQPAIASESMQAMAPRMQKAMSDIMDRIGRMAEEEAGKTKPSAKPEQRKN